MKTCNECGAPLSDDAQFCLSCGADVPQPETENKPYPEENTEPVEQQPVQQAPIQQQPVQQPVQQQPVQQEPIQQPVQQEYTQQQPAMYPQAAPQQPMQQQPAMYPQQPMQQPGMYRQPMQQPWMYQEPEQKRGSSNKTLLYVLIPLIAIGAVVGILFATGVFSGKKDAAKADQQEVTAQVQLAEPDQNLKQVPQNEETQPTALSAQNVTLAGITFPLAEDYEVIDRKKLNDSEACLIVPKGAADRSNRLVLRIYPNMLDGVDGITNEEIGDLLHGIVDANAGVFANKEKSGFKLDRPYKIHYDDNANGSYFPHCYTYLNWTDREGKYSRSYTEATLVKRIVVSGSAIATDQGELNALTDIYSEVVQAANE